MCTVTFIPKIEGQTFLLTSNRDEIVGRNAIMPKLYEFNGVKVAYPKEPLAGGTWFAMSQTGRVCCLLNGAFEPHKKQNHHVLSRGEILLKAVTSFDGVEIVLDKVELNKVQPFTLLTIDQVDGEIQYFSKFIWDGHQVYVEYPDQKKPHIWSSVTLYNKAERAMRKTWFLQFLAQREIVQAEDVLSFHHSENSDNPSVNILMKRDQGPCTVSVTQVGANKSGMEMLHEDLISEKAEKLCIAREIIGMEL